VDQGKQISSTLSLIEVGFEVAAGLTLFVAALGLLNIGIASVRERSRDLSIRRAMGATRARIFALVLLSSVSVGVLAAAVAVLLAWMAVELVVPQLVNPAVGLPPPGFPWQAAALAMGLGIGVSGLGGLLPAAQASRVAIADALRE
jgi:putative ABC transport system permease protein